MKILSPDDTDWRLFLALAREEGWRVPASELELYRGVLAESAFVLRRGKETLGFVTAVHHERSGWIGNLIVHRALRGRGCGTMLFDHAIGVLERRGAESLWLTASPLGRPLYEKKGFAVVDGVVRWTLRTEGGRVDEGRAETDRLLTGDARVWGESRERLVAALARKGEIFAAGGSVALLQRSDNGMQVLGPWISAELCPRENRRLLLAVLSAAAEKNELVADVLESSPLQPLLRAAGFERRGRCDLMVRGGMQGVRLTNLVALASLGSIG